MIIEKNIPIPPSALHKRRSKYSFLKDMEVGDSVNTEMVDNRDNRNKVTNAIRINKAIYSMDSLKDKDFTTANDNGFIRIFRTK